MRTWRLRYMTGICVAAALAVLATPRPAHAFIHEIIAAMCRAPAGDVEPKVSCLVAKRSYGRSSRRDSSSPSRRLPLKRSFISISRSPPRSSSRPGSTCRPGGGTDGKTWVRSPLLIPHPEFAAHAHCANPEP